MKNLKNDQRFKGRSIPFSHSEPIRFAQDKLREESYETLHGACPEGDSSVATLLQNDRKRRVQDDKGM